MRSSVLRLGAALFAVLAGCRTLPPAPPAGESWEVRRPQLQSVEHFALRGRLAVAAAGEGFNAGLRWTQEGNRSQVTLEGPLGVGGAQLTASGDDLTVVTARGERIESAAAHAELAALTQAGWHVEYQSYSAASGETLPARMTLQRDAVRVRLLVDDWQR